MPDHVTLVRPRNGSSSARTPAALPTDIIDQVRRRVRILALLMLAAFSFDLVAAAFVVASAWLAGRHQADPS